MTAPFLDTQHFAGIIDRSTQNYRKEQERKSIEEILNMASQGGDEESFNKSIAQVLQNVSPENQGVVFERIQQVANQKGEERRAQEYREEGLNPYLPDAVNIQKMKNQRLSALTGASGEIDWDNASRNELQQLMTIPEFKAQAANQIKKIDDAEKFYKEKESEIAPYKAALQIADELENVLENNYWSYGPLVGKLNQTPGANEAKQQILTLGNSLLQMALAFPIRNQKEFQEAQRSLTNPNSTYSTNMGAVKALKKMINAQLNSAIGGQGSGISEASDVSGISDEAPQLDQQSVNRLF